MGSDSRKTAATTVTPLLEVREERRVALLAVGANRGLCGAYNTTVARETLRARTELVDRGVAVDLVVSGKRLADAADIAIDNCVEPEDAGVPIEGRPEKVAALSTVAAISISMALVAEVGRELAARHVDLSTFVSPNVAGIGPDHNQQVFQEYTAFIRRIGDPTA